MKLRQEFGFNLSFTAFEIYNEKLIDLLVTKKHNRIFVPLDQNKKHKGYVPEVDQLNSVDLEDLYAFRDLFELSQSNKKIGENKLNPKSSRSHCIYKLSLSFNNKETSLYLIDLAGVERSKYLDMSKANAPQMTETCNINRSLTTLSRCFQSLKDNTVVPYRESKLTKLLFDNMAKEVSISIIINFNSNHSSFEDNLRVLEFAAIAKEINADHMERNVSFVAMKSRNKLADSSYKYLNERFNESKKKRKCFIKEQQKKLQECLSSLKGTLKHTMQNDRLNNVKGTLRGINNTRIQEIETQKIMDMETLGVLKGGTMNQNDCPIEPTNWDEVENIENIEAKVLQMIRQNQYKTKTVECNKENVQCANKLLSSSTKKLPTNSQNEIQKLNEVSPKESAQTQKEVARSYLKHKMSNNSSMVSLQFDNCNKQSYASCIQENSFKVENERQDENHLDNKVENLQMMTSILEIDKQENESKNNETNTQDTLATFNNIDESNIGGKSNKNINENAIDIIEEKNDNQINADEIPDLNPENETKPRNKRGRGRGRTRNKQNKAESKQPKELQNKPVKKKKPPATKDNVYVDFLAFIAEPHAQTSSVSNNPPIRNSSQSNSCDKQRTL